MVDQAWVLQTPVTWMCLPFDFLEPKAACCAVDRVVNLRDEKLSLFKRVPAPMVTFVCPCISLYDVMLDHVYISSAFCLFASF